MENKLKNLEAIFNSNLNKLGFSQLGNINFFDGADINIWKRKVLFGNNAVVLCHTNNISYIEKLLDDIKFIVKKNVGYVWGFYPIGLQVVICGYDVLSHSNQLELLVDKYATTDVIMQSVFLLDLNTMKFSSVRTWGQFYSGRFQNQIEISIDEFCSRNI